MTAVLALHLAGCASENRVPCHPVRGTLEVDGQPAAGAVIVLHPLQTPADPHPKPVATTSDDGSFTLTTFDGGDGAPVGEYAVTVVWRAEREIGEEMVREGPNLLPPVYAAPSTSGITFQVVAGENVIPPLKLKRGPGRAR